MRSSVRIATIGDIEIGIHYSWFLIFFLVAWTLAVGLFPVVLPGAGVGTYWSMGFVASFLLFVSVLIHELAHSVVAESLGLRVKGITLFIFGGVSNISGEPTSARDELFISAVGPLTSLALGAVFWGISQVVRGSGPVEEVLFYLAFINVLLAAFNLIPGFPLDGGRVLRALVWWATNNYNRATQVAVWAGHAVGFLFIFVGIFIAFSGAFISGIWLALIGWFIVSAAGASARETEQRDIFQNVTVGEVMNPHPLTVQSETSLSDVVHNLILQRAVRTLPVVEDGQMLGMITLNEIRNVPRERWDATPVRAVMTGREDLQTVGPTDTLDRAVSLLVEHDINQLPVVDDGELVGLLSRDNVMRFLQIRQELGLPSGEEERRRAA